MVFAFMREYPLEMALSSLALLVVGLTDVIGVAALVPLFAIIVNNETDSGSMFSNIVDDSLAWFGIDPTVESMLLILCGATILKSVLNMGAMTQVAYASTKVGANWRERLLDTHLKASWPHLTMLPAGQLIVAASKESERITANYNS